jgi:hypothetical protein
MPDEVFRRRALYDAFSILLAAEIGDESGNLLLLVWSLIGQSRQALAPQAILARDLVTKDLHEPVSFLIFRPVARQCGRDGQCDHAEQSDPIHDPSQRLAGWHYAPVLPDASNDFGKSKTINDFATVHGVVFGV